MIWLVQLSIYKS